MATQPFVEYGPRTALHWSEVEQITARARRIMREHPRGHGFGGGGSGRQERLAQLAAEYAIDLRTLYRYLRLDEPATVRVGAWSAVFATRDDGEGRPTQLGGWVHDAERSR